MIKWLNDVIKVSGFFHIFVGLFVFAVHLVALAFVPAEGLFLISFSEVPQQTSCIVSMTRIASCAAD